ncbi:hypothetical protein RF55_10111 [Lasius niger]|uniref:Uncharacterized protein n=1 Tax=Lasius niger TaxID=67767 RepID=A0A0J7KIX5_LASNI|nr:hypothetical protein RF55_10111 [Lasius niger]
MEDGSELIKETILQIENVTHSSRASETRPRTAERKPPQNLAQSAANPKMILHTLGSLTLFPYQNPQGCHAARRMRDDDPSKVAEVLVALLQSVVDADDADVGSDAGAAAGDADDAAAAAAAVGDDDDDDGGGDDGRSTD